jgi:hypothetical protein
MLTIAAREHRGEIFQGKDVGGCRLLCGGSNNILRPYSGMKYNVNPSDHHSVMMAFESLNNKLKYKLKTTELHD